MQERRTYKKEEILAINTVDNTLSTLISFIPKKNNKATNNEKSLEIKHLILKGFPTLIKRIVE